MKINKKRIAGKLLSLFIISSPAYAYNNENVDCSTILRKGFNNGQSSLITALGCYTIAIENDNSNIGAYLGRRFAAIELANLRSDINNYTLYRIIDDDFEMINGLVLARILVGRQYQKVGSELLEFRGLEDLASQESYRLICDRPISGYRDIDGCIGSARKRIESDIYNVMVEKPKKPNSGLQEDLEINNLFFDNGMNYIKLKSAEGG